MNRTAHNQRETDRAPKNEAPPRQWLYNLRRMAQRALKHPDEGERQLKQIVAEIDGQLKDSQTATDS